MSKHIFIKCRDSSPSFDQSPKEIVLEKETDTAYFGHPVKNPACPTLEWPKCAWIIADMKVNNYRAEKYDDNEVVIYTESNQLRINRNKVYLTTLELEYLYKLATGIDISELKRKCHDA